MFEIPTITGKISHIDIKYYNNIINNYVHKTSKLEAVSSIIQMGSFSAPGLSDIDIILVIDENKTLPKWEEISLLKLSSDLMGNEVIAHDVFVIPKSIADKAEAYFFIDQQNVLYGNSIGGQLENDVVERCRYFLAFDYSIFSLENLFIRLLTPTIDIRNLALFISTMRHTLTLGEKLNIIESKNKEAIYQRIEKFRQSVLTDSYDITEIHNLLSLFLKYLIITYKSIGEVLGLEKLNGKNISLLKKSDNTFYVEIPDEEDYIKIFQEWLFKNKSFVFSKYVNIIPIPSIAIKHFQAYLSNNFQSASELNTIFKIEQQVDNHPMNKKIRKLRVDIAYKHWNFLYKTGYQSSGVTYIGFSNPYSLGNSLKRGLKRGLRSLLAFILYHKP